MIINKTQEKTSAVVDGNVITQDVYEKIETVEKVTKFNKAELDARKAILLKEIADIDIMLGGIEKEV